MTVKELIAELQKMPPDAEFFISYCGDYGTGELTEIDYYSHIKQVFLDS